MNADTICAVFGVNTIGHGRPSSPRTSLEHPSHVRFGPPVASFQGDLALLLVEHGGLFRAVWHEGKSRKAEKDRWYTFDDEQQLPIRYADMGVLDAEREEPAERPRHSTDAVVDSDTQPDLVACVEQRCKGGLSERPSGMPVLVVDHHT